MATISDQDLWEVAGLVQRKWSEAFDNLKHCREETWDKQTCPKADWPLFQRERLRNTEKEFRKWDELRKRIVSELPRLGVSHG